MTFAGIPIARARVLLALAASCLAPLAGAQAQVEMPAAVDLVAPFPAGGGAEFAARQLAGALGRTAGLAVNVVTRPGEDGLTGALSVVKAAPDGRTLLLGSASSLIHAPLARGRPPIDPAGELEPIALIASIPRLIVVHPSVPASTVDGLVRMLRADPAAVPCGTSDAVAEHAAQTFGRLAGVSLACTEYPQGTGDLRRDLGSGKVKLAFESTLLADVQAGRLRPLAVAGPSRLRALPDVPTASEAGLPAFDLSVWLGVFAPAKTPPAIVARYAELVARAMEDPAAVSALQGWGYVIRVTTGRPLREYLDAEVRSATRAGVPPRVPERPAR